MFLCYDANLFRLPACSGCGGPAGSLMMNLLACVTAAPNFWLHFEGQLKLESFYDTCSHESSALATCPETTKLGILNLASQLPAQFSRRRPVPSSRWSFVLSSVCGAEGPRKLAVAHWLLALVAPSRCRCEVDEILYDCA